MTTTAAPAGGATLLPIATPATPDLICWLWAAFPPRGGQLHIRRIAEALGVSPTTLRRWIADPTGRHFDSKTQRYLIQRAILRGRGTYLWPPLDPTTQERSAGERDNAINATRSIARGIYPPAWKTNGTLAEHDIFAVEYPRAHAYGIHVIRTDKSRARIDRTAKILDHTTAEHRYLALAIKHTLLGTVAELRCITPAALVATGRTDTWRARGYTGVSLRNLKRRCTTAVEQLP